jgi:hypothetical protein
MSAIAASEFNIPRTLITCPWVTVATVLLPTIEPHGFDPPNWANTEFVQVSNAPVAKSSYEKDPIDP